ncbi:hypothetical protein GCM10008933_44910 [Paenibacillus motobuensis]|uniref:Uncharacterized protein n=1 Tax=Paenibacillus motobuensis TaxID=295324 RepID=A0ABN0YTJ3_9BACL
MWSVWYQHIELTNKGSPKPIVKVKERLINAKINPTYLFFETGGVNFDLALL